MQRPRSPRALRIAAIALGLGVACSAARPVPTVVDPRASAPPAAGAVRPSPAAPGSRSTRATIAGAPAAGSYQLTITMTADTVQALATSGYALVGFKAVTASDRAGQPLVWFATTSYSLATVVTWQASYRAYIALHDTAPSVAIDAIAAYDIQLGQALDVQLRAGTGTVTTDGTAGAITIDNETTTQLTCGISQQRAGTAAPVVVFPLYGQQRQVIAPVDQVLLMFSTAALVPGTAVATAPDPGVLVDLSDAHARALHYDINLGWSADAAPWLTNVAAGANLASLLILLPP
jgi:hypothetical protein